ncbi:MAG: hypothetical protein OXU68_00730, partial [Bacteroidota bacterium]|nr:hypothetical protein [Bacteroidota bacterium]
MNFLLNPARLFGELRPADAPGLLSPLRNVYQKQILTRIFGTSPAGSLDMTIDAILEEWRAEAA